MRNTADVMSKRSATCSPAEGNHVAKKAKPAAIAIDITDQECQQRKIVDGRTPAENLTDVEETEVKTPVQIVSGKPGLREGTLQPDFPALLTVEPTVEGKKKNMKPKQPTKEAFDRSWKQAEAADNAPAEVLPHWGIVPLSANYRPTEPQPSARSSDAEVRPRLWEDRKGEIRLQGPTRYIEGYDQAQHMYLPLMDQRCAAGSVKPRHKPVHYWYKAGGMLLDWTNSKLFQDKDEREDPPSRVV